jgi:hypothetical protein
MITKLRAKEICSHWHGGQWSALYQFTSSGVYLIANHRKYLRDIEDCLHPEYNLHLSKLSIKNETELTRLKKYFIAQGNAAGIHGVTETKFCGTL